MFAQLTLFQIPRYLKMCMCVCVCVCVCAHACVSVFSLSILISYQLFFINSKNGILKHRTTSYRLQMNYNIKQDCNTYGWTIKGDDFN